MLFLKERSSGVLLRLGSVNCSIVVLRWWNNKTSIISQREYETVFVVVVTNFTIGFMSFLFKLMISNFLHAVLMSTLVTGQWCECLSDCLTCAGANVFSLIAALLCLLLLKVFFGAFRPISKSRVWSRRMSTGPLRCSDTWRSAPANKIDWSDSDGNLGRHLSSCAPLHDTV